MEYTGIKELLDKSENAEIRIGLKNAEEMGIKTDDISIVELFKKGIAVDIVIKKVEDGDFLPNRLEKFIEDGDIRNIEKGFVKLKVVNNSDGSILNALEISGLLLKMLDNDFKVASIEEDGEHFSKIRIESIKKDRFLNVKEVRDLLKKPLFEGGYEYLAEEINNLS